MTEIFKLQRPVSGGDAPVLAYNKDRSKTFTMPLTRELDAKFAARFKIYCQAHVEDKKLTVGLRVADQEW